MTTPTERIDAEDDFWLVDADTHYYEPRDCFTRYIDPEFADKAVRRVTDDSGHEQVVVGSRIHTFLDQPFKDTAVRPGALREMMRNIKIRSMRTVEEDDSGLIVDILPEFQEREPRLAVMDEQHVESAVVVPTLAVTVEHFLKDDPAATAANLHAFNRWLEEQWGFAYEGRIFAPPLISLLDLDLAVKELEWVIERGSPLIHIRPGPVHGRSPADPMFDPFWARVNEANIRVASHLSESSYNEMFSVAWGEHANPGSHAQSAFQWAMFFCDRPIMDTLASMIFMNLFGRFPNIEIASIENGAGWVPYLLRVMDKTGGLGRNGPWPGGRLTDRPSTIFKQHVYVSPYHEEDNAGLAGVIGAERVLFGSDWPHPEGLADPITFKESLGDLPAADVKKIMRDNGRRFLRLDPDGSQTNPVAASL